MLARYLRARGVGPGKRVALCLLSSPDLIAGVLAILKIGASFVPLDSANPPGRLRQIVADAGARAILTETALRRNVGSIPADLILVDRAGEGPPGQVQPHIVRPEDEACVLYTSGSTGTPNGVIRTHRAIVSRLAWTSEDAGEVRCHNMPLTAGFSQERLFVPLMRGSPLALAGEESFKDPAKLADDIEALEVTELTIVPIMLRRLLELGSGRLGRLTSLRTIVAGGAELPIDLIRSFATLLPDVALVNAYGSTETGSVIRGGVPLSRSGPVTIGKPLPNVAVYILDENRKRVPEGDVGELYVSAPSVTSGYVNRPELTAERLLRNPFVHSTEWLYRTGDRGRILAAGEIQLTGRADRQVKIRGFRVELQEIEAALEKHTAVNEAAVIAVATKSGARLHAYVAPQSGVRLTVSGLRSCLAANLPPHMIPATFVMLDRLPRGFNGKVDHQNLPPAPASRPDLDAPYQPPRDSTESAIVEIWEKVLGISGVGVHDHFLELGGDSLCVVRAALEIHERLGIEIPGDKLIALGTPAAVAERVS